MNECIYRACDIACLLAHYIASGGKQGIKYGNSNNKEKQNKKHATMSTNGKETNYEKCIHMHRATEEESEYEMKMERAWKQHKSVQRKSENFWVIQFSYCKKLSSSQHRSAVEKGCFPPLPPPPRIQISLLTFSCQRNATLYIQCSSPYRQTNIHTQRHIFRERIIRWRWIVDCVWMNEQANNSL